MKLSRRSSTPIALALGAAFLAFITAMCFLASANGHFNLLSSGTLMLLAFSVFMAVGCLIVARRPENSLGWIYAAIGMITAVGTAASEYAIYAFVTRDAALPGSAWAAWFANMYWYPLIVLVLVIVPLLFPTGAPASPRWRPLLWLTILTAGSISVLAALDPWLDYGAEGIGVANPIGVAAVGDIEKSAAGSILFPIILVCALGAIVSMVLRFRRSRGDERLQLKWFTYAAALLVLVPLGDMIPSGSPVALAVWDVLFGLILVFLPAATGIAILKYRLYDIDVVINKTLVYGSLAAFITAVYVTIVVGLGWVVGRGDDPNLALSIAATAVVAIAFQPVRGRVQHLANRLVYGKRATPYEVLAEFSHRLAGTQATEHVLPGIGRALAEGTGASAASVWLNVGGELRQVARWPAGKSEDMRAVPVAFDQLPQLPKLPEATLALPVHQGEELLGVLTLLKGPGERLSSAEEKLAADVASQAGLMLRNVRLDEELLLRLEELQASRQRIVAAQDEERRRLERDIHDGAQQQLVALAVKIGLARQFVERDPQKAETLLSQLEGDTGDALENLRDLARGIYPPLLAERGLEVALEAQGRKVSLPVEVEAERIGRYPQDVEAAVYFSALEALQNVTKYAQASRAVVRLVQSNGTLLFEIEDDGRGFDPRATGYGTGLQGMADRLEAVGGALEVESTPGDGARVVGRVPAIAEAP